MKKVLLLFTLLLLATSILQAQDIPNNAAYNSRMDSLKTVFSDIMKEWNRAIPPHNVEAMRLEKEAKAHPELQDSLLAIAGRERETAREIMAALQARINSNSEERQALRDRYALVFEDAFPYFLARKQYTKDSLSVLLKSASAEIRHSRQGKGLRKYIKNRQLSEGDHFRTFPCWTPDGRRFNWSHCKGKKVFLIHDGLWCMNHGLDKTALRKYLEFITKTAPDCFPLIVVDCLTLEELKAVVEEFELQAFCVVSEFQKDAGTLNWLYNDTTTPTCHYLDENRAIMFVTEGIEPEILEHQFLGIK